MKLYTEEQLTRYLLDEGIIELSDLANNLIPYIELPSDSLCINCDESESTHNICMDCIIKIGKENIQLPSDEEIDEETLEETALSFLPHSEVEHDTCFIIGFEFGFKYVLNKIQGGNNEQQ